MDDEPGVRFVPDLEGDDAPEAAHRAGATSYVLPRGVVDRARFFDAVRATLPLDPPLQGSASWDALADSLWEGLHQARARRVWIVWPGADAMARAARDDFALAVRVMASVIELLADASATNGRPTAVTFIVEAPAIEPV